MEPISTALNWTFKLIATWYGSAIIGGVLILAFERRDRRREPTDADVQQAAERYHQWYGDEALAKIGDHMLAASFAPDGRHKRFLKRVSIQLQARFVSELDRQAAIEG